MTAPLTDQQLDVWAADLTWITKGPWLVAGSEYDQPMIYVEYEGSDGRTAVRTLLAGAAATETDVQFMTRSPERIAALLAEVTRLRAELEQARAEPVRPSPDHSAVYMDGDRQVWSEYKTVPESDAVLPLVWAAEKVYSRADLADQGTELRIVGWIK